MWWLMTLGMLSLASSITILAVSGGREERDKQSDTPSVRGERQAVAVAYVDVEGGVRPLYPAVPGRVVEAPVPEGKEVEAGAVLLRIDDTLAKARLKEAKLVYEAAKEKLTQAKKLVSQHQTKIVIQKAALKAAKKKLEAAQTQAQKVRRLFDKDLQGGKEDIEASNKLVEEATAGVEMQQASLELIQSFDPEGAVRIAQFEADAKKEEIEKADLGVRECSIVAPCRGVILRRMVNIGEVLGQTPNRPAIEFCPSGDRIVRAEVEQEYASKLFVGQKARITDEFTGVGQWEGEVIRISDWYTQRRTVLLEPMQYNDSRTLEVIIRLKASPKGTLRINQRVRVYLAGS
jgi:multidrug resistance efflux pump